MEEKREEELTKRSIAISFGTTFIIFFLIIVAIATVSVGFALWLVWILVVIPIGFVVALIWHHYAHKDKDLNKKKE